MKDNLKAMLEVREIIAIGVTGMFIALGILGKIDPKIIEFVVISVISFYFASKGNGSATEIATNVVSKINTAVPTVPAVDEPVITAEPAQG